MKTQLDLMTSAEATARLMMQAPNLFAAEQTKLENFESTGQDQADFELWEGQVNQRLQQYRGLVQQKAPSQVLADQAAAAAKAAAAKPQSS